MERDGSGVRRGGLEVEEEEGCEAEAVGREERKEGKSVKKTLQVKNSQGKGNKWKTKKYQVKKSKNKSKKKKKV